MSWYRVGLNGQNFLLRLEEGSKKHGFYTTRDVEAESFEVAELNAIELIRNDQKLLDITENKKADSPMIYVDDIRMLEPDEEKLNNIGFILYLE